MTLVLAHRGASVEAPENTLVAFELAVEQRADMIETDLHLTRDRCIPLWHDARIEGTPIESLTMAEIRERWPSVPTLEETLERLGKRIEFNLELKSGVSGDYAGLEERALEGVKQLTSLDRVLFSSFSWESLARMRALEPSARIGVLRSGRFVTGRRAEETAKALRAEALHPALRRLDATQVARMHAQGLRVNVYTVDDPREQQTLIEWGVDGIFTNEPLALRQRLERRAAAKG